MNKKRVAILVSGRGSNMAALIEAAKAADYPAQIVSVISNNPQAGGLAIARAAGITTETIAHDSDGMDRAAFEQALQNRLEKSRIDLVCLAGFMRLLSPWFVEQWKNRMLNIHPALLPAFKGLNTHKRALEAGVKLHGATVHFVVPEMDSGPILAQGALAIADNDDVQSLAARVLAIEHELYPRALKWVAEGRVQVEDNRCLVREASAPGEYLMAPQ